MAIADLWRQVAESPEDLSPRLVLADALVEAGDSRGELILLQCASLRGHDYADAKQRIADLIDANQMRWLGDVALVIGYSGWFEHGMLVDVQVGLANTPDWAYAQVRGHRELSVVRRVKRTYQSQTTVEQYVAFVTGLVNQPVSLEIKHAAELDALRRWRARWTTRALRSETTELDGVETTFPDLERFELTLDDDRLLGPQLAELVPRLARLRNIEAITLYNVRHAREQLEPLVATVPVLELR